MNDELERLRLTNVVHAIGRKLPNTEEAKVLLDVVRKIEAQAEHIANLKFYIMWLSAGYGLLFACALTTEILRFLA